MVEAKPTVRLLNNTKAELTLEQFKSTLTDFSKTRIESPFSESIIEFFDTFSKALFAHGRAKMHPDIVSLAFWMRKSELIKHRENFSALATHHTLRTPRGTVFHIAPSNVDTIFVYSWLVSALVGNRNIIRVSSQNSPEQKIIFEGFETACSSKSPAAALLRENTMILTYPHDDEITSALSANCDARLVWGGDSTISKIRSMPLPPHAKDISFADKFSLSILNANRFVESDDSQKLEVATAFYNDLLWFDQMACSSPRLLIWIGEKNDCLAAAEHFYPRLADIIKDKNYRSAMGIAVKKANFAFAAAAEDHAVTVKKYGPHLYILRVHALTEVSRENCGGGLLFEATLPNLTDLADSKFIGRSDQTCTYFGFNHEDIKGLIIHLNGRGIDRVVPVGQALNFNRYWDGYDLFQELSRVAYFQ